MSLCVCLCNTQKEFFFTAIQFFSSLCCSRPLLPYPSLPSLFSSLFSPFPTLPLPPLPSSSSSSSSSVLTPRNNGDRFLMLLQMRFLPLPSPPLLFSPPLPLLFPSFLPPHTHNTTPLLCPLCPLYSFLLILFVSFIHLSVITFVSLHPFYSLF